MIFPFIASINDLSKDIKTTDDLITFFCDHCSWAQQKTFIWTAHIKMRSRLMMIKGNDMQYLIENYSELNVLTLFGRPVFWQDTGQENLLTFKPYLP